MDKKPDEPKEDELDSLEQPSTVVENNDDKSVDEGVISAESDRAQKVGPPPKPPLGKRIINSLFSFNIYLLLFVFVLAVSGIVVLFSYNYSKKKSHTTTTVKTTTLNQDTLNQLASSDATVGSSDQVLNVQSSAVFAGKVLARSDVEIAGNLQIGGSLNIPNLNVSDTANLGQATISKNLAVTGNSAVQGNQTIAGTLQVGGGGSFSGNLSAPQVATNNLQLSSDLTLTHHLVAGGGTPSRSNGTALGSGGTVSLSGSDTAGSISINTGSGPSAGCFANISFTGKYNSTPHVLVTPVGSAAGGIGYYINRSTTGFSICTASPAPANAGFGFDYFVIG